MKTILRWWPLVCAAVLALLYVDGRTGAQESRLRAPEFKVDPA
jgi:hypothetical protein